MVKFKAFTSEVNDPFIIGLKDHLHGVIVITSLVNDEEGYDDQYLGEKSMSRHIIYYAGTSRWRASGKRSMIEILKERVFRLEEVMNDMIDFVKEEGLKRTKKK